MSYFMENGTILYLLCNITIDRVVLFQSLSVPESIKQKLDWVIKKDYLNQSDIIREALRQYFARQEFHQLRQFMVPEAESQGIYTDEDVFCRVS